MYCQKCGTKLEDGYVCCPNCGTFINEEPEEKETQNKEATAVYGKQSNGFAVAAFICSFFEPILGWIFGGIGLSKSKKLGGSGKALAIAAIIISVFVFIFQVIYAYRFMQDFMEELKRQYPEIYNNMAALYD